MEIKNKLGFQVLVITSMICYVISLSNIQTFNTFDYYETAFNWINIAYGILASNIIFNIKWK